MPATQPAPTPRPLRGATLEAREARYATKEAPVKKWTLVDQALTPDGKTVSLHEHDGSYTIRLDGVVLMTTRQHGSEEKLAELACAHLREKSRARILIGGLGFGFTLKASLAALAPDAAVVVAELLPAVIAWNRNPAFALAAEALDDPRVTVLRQDVAEVIRAERGGFDSIVLDVDNGPSAMSIEGNSRLYDRTGLHLIRAALRPEGYLALWSVEPDPAFQNLLTRAGFTVEVQGCRSRGTSGRRHTLFLGRVQ
jgi:spermidine synthase